MSSGSYYDGDVVPDSECEGDEYRQDAVPVRVSPSDIEFTETTFHKQLNTATKHTSTTSGIETIDSRISPSNMSSGISSFTVSRHATSNLMSSIVETSTAERAHALASESGVGSSASTSTVEKKARPKPRFLHKGSTTTAEEHTADSSAPVAPLMPSLETQLTHPPKSVGKRSHPPGFITISSSDVEPVIANPPSKKRKTSSVHEVHNVLLKEATAIHNSDVGHYDDDDPMLLKSPPPSNRRGAIPPSSTPLSAAPSFLRRSLPNDDRETSPGEVNVDHITIKSKRPKKRKSKRPAADDEADLVVTADIMDDTVDFDRSRKPARPKGKNKRKSAKVADDPDLPGTSDGAKETHINVCSQKGVMGETSSTSPAKRKAEADLERPRKKKGKPVEETVVDLDNEESSGTASKANNSIDETPSDRISPGEAIPKKRSKDRKKKKKDEESISAEGPEMEMSAGSIPISHRKGMVVEVVIEESPKSEEQRVRLPISTSSPDMPEVVSNSPADLIINPRHAPCHTEPVNPTPAKPMAGTVTTPVTSSSRQSLPRSAISSWRRPNKPLTELLNQGTPGSQPRLSGLHKAIRIAPLHLNRKPPPPPLPPVPKRKVVNASGDGSDSDDETPKARIKRLVSELEALEGMDSRKANERRRELTDELGRLHNG